MDTSLVGRAKELEVASILIRNGIYVFWPLVDTGADLIAANRDASICIPVQVRFSSKGPALNLLRSDGERFQKPNTIIAFLRGTGETQRSWYVPFDAWLTKAVDRRRRDELVYVSIRANERWLAQFEGDVGVRQAFAKLLKA